MTKNKNTAHLFDTDFSLFQYKYQSFSKIFPSDHLFWYFSTHGTKMIFQLFCSTTMSLNVMMSEILVLTPPEKTNDEISRICQKTGFPGIFPAFWAGKIFFSKIGLRHFLNIIILRQCAKFHDKISSTARDIQEILFFQRKLAVPAIFRLFRLFLDSSGFKNKFF